MKKKEIKEKAREIEKALERAGKRLSKFPLELADPSIFEVEGVGLDRSLLEGVEGGLGRMEELAARMGSEVNELEVKLVQLRHARRVSAAARKEQKKADKVKRNEAAKAAKAARAEARAAKKAEEKAAKAAKKEQKAQSKAQKEQKVAATAAAV